MIKTIVKTAFLTLTVIALNACHHDDDTVDDLPQEELSNILLKITDAADGTTAVYDYQVNGSAYPTVKLTSGHIYNVTTTFKNGAEDVTSEIIQAKDEHFLVYDFPNSDITLTRTDGAASTRTDGNHVGLNTKWVVNTAAANSGAQVVVTLYHASKTVNEAAAASGIGKVYGTQIGGETDAKATYKISN